MANEISPNAYQCLAIATALEVYSRTGMKVNRAYTPTAMLDTATALTGKKFKRGQYLQAAAALREQAKATAEAQ